MTPTKLLVPFGMPASGKSTFARSLVEQGSLTDRQIVEPDYYRLLMAGDSADQSENEAVFNVVYGIVRARLRHNLTVWLDATNLTALPPDLAAKATYVCFDEPFSECLRRNNRRHQPVPYHAMLRMQQRFNNMETMLNGDWLVPSEVPARLEFWLQTTRTPNGNGTP